MSQPELSSTHKIMLCLGGIEIANFLSKALGLINAEDALLLVLHVTDIRPLHEFDFARHMLPGRGHRREAAEAQLHEAVRVQTEEVQAEVDQFFDRHPHLQYRFISATGRPEREISRIAREEDVTLVVLGTGPAAPAHTHEGPPHALSPLARFVVDHTRCDFLLLRSAGS